MRRGGGRGGKVTLAPAFLSMHDPMEARRNLDRRVVCLRMRKGWSRPGGAGKRDRARALIHKLHRAEQLQTMRAHGDLTISGLLARQSAAG